MKTSVVKQLKHPYISINPRISKGSPAIKGTRMRVIDIAIEYDRLGLTPDQIIDAHPHLTLEAIHDALSYYYENRSLMDEEIKKKRNIIKEIAQKIPSVLKEKIG